MRTWTYAVGLQFGQPDVRVGPTVHHDGQVEADDIKEAIDATIEKCRERLKRDGWRRDDFFIVSLRLTAVKAPT